MICIFFIGKLHMHPVGLKLTASPSTLLLQARKIPFELELIDLVLYYKFSRRIEDGKFLSKLGNY